MAERLSPHQQQVLRTNLKISILLLILTAYPYLFNNPSTSVAAFPSNEFEGLEHVRIQKFDIIQVSDVIERSIKNTRDTSELSDTGLVGGSTDKTKKAPTKALSISALGRTFDMILSKTKDLVTEDFTVTILDGDGRATQIAKRNVSVSVYDGYIEKDLQSKATATIDKRSKVMIAQIRTGSDVIMIEPTYLHLGSLVKSNGNYSRFFEENPKFRQETMIVYNLNDHKNINSSFSPQLETLCSSVNLSDSPAKDNSSLIESNESLSMDDIYKVYKPDKSNRLKREIRYFADSGRERTRCTLHLVADYSFYRHVGKGDRQTTINYLLAMIDRINQIYLPTVWETGEPEVKFTNIGFTVQNITIHQEYTRVSNGDLHYNMNTSRVWSAREFLDNFSRNSPPKQYCLAHLLTHRQFNTSVLGLAYVASYRFGNIGGLCSPAQHRYDAIYKHNTGISSSVGFQGETLITRQTDLVVAHELAHNLGSEHDSKECRPAPEQGGSYLMHPFSVMGFEKNNRFFSECSRLSIGQVIKRKGRSCFIPIADQICGNGVVELDEECDGGDTWLGSMDPCCDSSCRFTPGSMCSDRHSPCCSKCRVVRAGIRCREAEPYSCKQESTCDGRSAECPEPPPVVEDETCVGRGLCRRGECVPFCEANELISCLCTNPKDACRLCCKSSLNGTCTPFDINSPPLPDGLLCYRGICERGRCEQPIQDVVERLWDVIEDITFPSFIKFLLDNIVLVVLVTTIPIWCIATHFINQYDQRIKFDVINSIKQYTGREDHNPMPSAFLPRLFVDNDTISGPQSPSDIEMSKV